MVGDRTTGSRVAAGGRRGFLRAVAEGALGLAASSLTGACRSGPSARIDAIELFLVNVAKPRHFSHGTWRTRQHAVLRLGAAGASGWGEAIAGLNDDELDLAAWGRPLAELGGLELDEAFEAIASHYGEREWSWERLELAEMALYDLAGRLSARPAAELLGLRERAPVPGLYCILERDPERAATEARRATAAGLGGHVKVKLFGELELDRVLLETVRGIVAPGARIVGDPNRGYDGLAAEPEALEAALAALGRAGLTACEDPARLAPSEWIELQHRLPGLDLIPDYPLRPAWRGLRRARPGMGRIYNLHPGTMGSFAFMARLARRIRSWGAGVMIGDDSLVGPACTAWQQIAVGIGAVWVEALEKPQESTVFLDCVRSRPSYLRGDGRVAVRHGAPGFGLDVDRRRLEAAADGHAVLG